MKLLTFLVSLLFMTSLAHAVMYKWEDANGLHFTDNAEAVPKKYRPKANEAAKEVSKPVYTPPPSVPVQSYTVPAYSVPAYKTPAPASLATAQINQQAAEALKRQQDLINAQSRAQTAKLEKDVLQPVAKFVAFWMLFGVIAMVVWIATLVDIVRSDFTNPTNKVVWILLLVCIAPLGVILYYLIGTGQKMPSHLRRVW